MKPPGAAVVGTAAALPCASLDISIIRCVAEASAAVAILRCDGEKDVLVFRSLVCRLRLAARAKETCIEEYDNKMYLLD